MILFPNHFIMADTRGEYKNDTPAPTPGAPVPPKK